MTKIERGSGNVLVDLGIENAEDLTAKIQLAVAINRIIQGRHLKQVQIAKLLGIPQPKVSGLLNYKLDGFSVERLMNFLVALDRDVEIRIRKKPKSREAARLRVAAHG
ncbi:MAG TPA: helix-turn-helix transcriptional regulator [Kiloniellales bacterium]